MIRARRIEVYHDTLMLELSLGGAGEHLVGLGACGHMCCYAPFAHTRCCACNSCNWDHCFLCIKREKFSA